MWFFPDVITHPTMPAQPSHSISSSGSYLPTDHIFNVHHFDLAHPSTAPYLSLEDIYHWTDDMSCEDSFEDLGKHTFREPGLTDY